MIRYPIKQLKDKNELPFFPFNTLESVLVDGTGKNLADVLNNIYTKAEVNTMFATELSKFSVYPSQADLPQTARDGAVAATNENNVYIMYMYYSGAWRALTQKGDKGDKGDTGDTGATGPQGIPGPQGAQGIPGSVKMQIVEALPETGADDTIYLIAKTSPEDQNVYDEYIYTNSNWERIGDTSVNLDNYYTKEEADVLVNSKSTVYKWNGKASSTTPSNLALFQKALNDIKNGCTPLISVDYNNNGFADSKKGTILAFPNLSNVDLSTYKGTIYIYGISQTSTLNSTKTTLALGLNSDRPQMSISVSEGTVVSVSDIIYYNTAYSKGGDYLRCDNTAEYEPTSDYNPATKKYVDDSVANAGSSGATVTYIDDNSSSNPFVLEEHEPGIYMFKNQPYVKARTSNTVTKLIRTVDNIIYLLKKPLADDPDDTLLACFMNNVLDIGTLRLFSTFDSGLSFHYSTNTRGFVQINSTETIGGTKTFTNLPKLVAEKTPTDNLELVPKKYVDDAIAAAVTSALGGSY